MADASPPGRARLNPLKTIGFPLFLVAMVALGFVLRRTLWRFVGSADGVHAWVSQWGAGAPLVYVAVQVLQVFVFVIPGDSVQIAGGYLFGFWLGLILTIIGIAAGSSINFWLARALGRPLLERFFPKQQIDRLSAVANGSRAKVGFFLLFVIPGIPKDILCYVAGISPLRFPFFLAVSLLGRLPGMAGSTLMGSSAAKQQWTLSVIIFVVAVVLFAVGYLVKDRLHDWIDSHVHRHRE